MNDEDHKGGSASVIAALSMALYGSWQLATVLGADPALVLSAGLYSLPLAGAALFLWWYVSPPKISTLALFLAAAWPCWWPVLDSLAGGHADPNTGFLRLSMQLNNAWYAKAGAKWLIELAWVTLIVLGFRRQPR